jgi:D-ribose pyranase
MRRGGILNQPLQAALGRLGHGDLFIVSDVGFPIPDGLERIDLAFADGQLDLRTVLRGIHAECITEQLVYADEMRVNNPRLAAWLDEEFAGVQVDARQHTAMLSEVAASAKFVVRTGSFEPWGNIGLVSGVDAPRFFATDGVLVPDEYRDLVDGKAAN